MKLQVIIVAGGKGLRMGGEVPKQFLPVGGVPVLMRTLRRFHETLLALHHASGEEADPVLILVLPREQQDYWHSLCREHRFEIPCRLADGGSTRFHSVLSGLSRADAEGLIGVHDGVRPFVSAEVIRAAYAAAAASGAAVPVLPSIESLRRVEADGTSHPVERAAYRLVQTPQVFRADLLRAAYEQPYSDFFTDDASVVEACGQPMTLVEGNRENIKITTPWDLQIAEMLCRPHD